MNSYQRGALRALERRDRADVLLSRSRQTMSQALAEVRARGFTGRQESPAAMALIMCRFARPGETITRAQVAARMERTYPGITTRPLDLETLGDAVREAGRATDQHRTGGSDARQL